MTEMQKTERPHVDKLPRERPAIRLSVLGAGRWGPNLIRNFASARDVELVSICDLSAAQRRRIAENYPAVDVTDDPDAVLADTSLDAVVIATPTATHYELVRRALEAGKDVLVEKPLCQTIEQGEELVALAERHRRILLCGHVFLFNRAVVDLKRRMDAGELGTFYYMHARRTNLGPVRSDVHAGWDLATHDIAVFLYLKGAVPVEVAATGQCYIRPDIPDVVFATLYFGDGTVAHLHTSWLDPQKTRLLTLVGQRQMLVFDDMNLLEPLRVYDKGFERVGEGESGAEDGNLVDSFGAFRVELRDGDVLIPRISTGEPLRNECDAFLDAVRTRREPLSGAAFSLDVVRVLEAMDRSMADGSRRVAVR